MMSSTKCIPKCKYSSVDEYRLGRFRSTMNNNPLLKRAELGQTTRRYTLPSYLNKDYIYGKVNYSYDGGVAEAMIHQNYSPKPSKTVFPQNFVKLNARAIKGGLVTPKEHTHYRAITDIRVTSPEMRKLHFGSLWPDRSTPSVKIPPDMTFGISTRPSTPIFDVIENKFQLKWLQEMKDNELSRRARIKEKKKIQEDYETRTSLLRKFLPPVEVPNVWRMDKYKNIPPHLETFESPEKREAAFAKHKVDATSRRGLFGHGIYEPAKI